MNLTDSSRPGSWVPGILLPMPSECEHYRLALLCLYRSWVSEHKSSHLLSKQFTFALSANPIEANFSCLQPSPHQNFMLLWRALNMHTFFSRMKIGKMTVYHLSLQVWSQRWVNTNCEGMSRNHGNQLPLLHIAGSWQDFTSLLHAQMELEPRRQMKLFKIIQPGKGHPSHHNSASLNPIATAVPSNASSVPSLGIS